MLTRSRLLATALGLTFGLLSVSGPAGVPPRASGAAAPKAPALRWHDARPLPQPLGGLAAATDNGYLFVSGGYNGLYQRVAYSTQSLADGSLKNWRHIASLPVPLYGHSMAAALGSLYVLGGTTNGLDTGAQRTVYRARLQPGGKTGAWSTAGALPIRTYGQGAAARGGYLYVAGGYVPNQGYSSAVYVAPLNSHGLAGRWRALSALPEPRFGLALVARPGYLFAVGGMSQGVLTNAVYGAALRKNGGISPWRTLRPLPHPLARVGAAVVGSYLVVAGGARSLNLTNPVDTVYAAPIVPGGTLGTWRTVTALRSAAAAPALLMIGKYLYVLGGFNGKVYDSSVLLACPPFFSACSSPTTAAPKKAKKP